MATITLEHGCLKVWIESNGVPLTVYRVNEETNRTTCFIASEEDKRFSVHCAPAIDKYGPHDHKISVFVDGKRVKGQVFLKGTATQCSVAGIQETPSSLKPFEFSRLLLTDDESSRADEATLKELGTIKITKEAVVAKLEGLALWQPDTVAPDTGPIHEKAKKAGSHCTKLGDAVPSVAPPTYNLCSVTSLELPLHEFVFQYASLDWLQAQEIVPRPDPPPPAPNTAKRERSTSLDLDETNIKLLEAGRGAPMANTKNKLVSRKKAKMKAEPEIKITSHLLDGDAVIDLTSDSEEE